MSHCLRVTSMPAISGSNWIVIYNRRLGTGHKDCRVHVSTLHNQHPSSTKHQHPPRLFASLTAIEEATHQIFGTRVDNPRSSLRFSDSRYHSSTLFSSGCTQNIRYSGRCSSLGSPSPCSPLRPLELFPRRKTPNIHKRRSRDALSSIHAPPWRKLLWIHLLHAQTETHARAGVCFGGYFKKWNTLLRHRSYFLYNIQVQHGLIHEEHEVATVCTDTYTNKWWSGACVRTSSSLPVCGTPPLWATVSY